MYGEIDHASFFAQNIITPRLFAILQHAFKGLSLQTRRKKLHEQNKSLNLNKRGTNKRTKFFREFPDEFKSQRPEIKAHRSARNGFI